MSQGDKSQLWNELKAAGVKFEHHYREYSTEELQAAVDWLREDPGYVPPQEREPEPARIQVPQVHTKVATQHAAEDAYKEGYDETPLRTDPDGKVWYRDEVLKPAFPKPRARRRITYVDPGSKTQTVQNGKYVETVEVAGDEKQTREVKITMPSYQVGIYKDPRLPFRVHIYNGNRGFDLFEVRKYYGGADLVPREIKTLYVGNDLCYDIVSTRRAIEQEFMRLQQQRGFRA